MRQRGFTLTELTIVMSLTGIVAGASGLLYLEIRTAGAIVEAQVSLERRAGLVLEAVARDLRGGSTPATTQAISDGGTVTIERPPQVIHYSVLDGTLRRKSDFGERTLARSARALSIDATDGGHIVRLALERQLRRGRTLRVERLVFVGVRQ